MQFQDPDTGHQWALANAQFPLLVPQIFSRKGIGGEKEAF